MNPPKCFSLAATCACLLAATSARAQLNLANDMIDKATGTRLELRSVFDPIPPTGHVPVRAVITSGSSRDSTWSFDFNKQSGGYDGQHSQTSSFRVGVPANSTQSALFLVPLVADYGSSRGFGNGSFSVNVGAGVFGSRHYAESGDSPNDFPSIAISPALADSSVTKLDKELESRRKSASMYGGNVKFGSQFKLDDLPEDWLGYSGFDYLMFSHTDWAKLRPGVRRAVEQWIRLGGELHLYAPKETTDAALGIPGGEGNLKRPVGHGRVARFEWDGKELPDATTVGRYWSAERRLADLQEGRTSIAKGSNYWPLVEAIGERSFASWQVVLFLVVFGILVGPVNLFVLAPSGRRHRLFVTTPLLSLGASALMVGVILLQDGTGGMGARFVAIEVQPGEAAGYVTQEQVSRTGVLLSGAFEMKQTALVEPVCMAVRPWVKLHSGQNAQKVALTQEGLLRSGSHFQSRAEQGQILRAAVSTRARIEKKAGSAPNTPPTLISSLGFSVSQLFYIDESGEAWKSSAALASGSEATLAKCDIKELRAAWDAAVEPASPQLRKALKLQTATLQRGHFFAVAAEAPGFTLATLSAIDWDADRVALFGHVATP